MISLHDIVSYITAHIDLPTEGMAFHETFMFHQQGADPPIQPTPSFLPCLRFMLLFIIVYLFLYGCNEMCIVILSFRNI